MMERVQNINRWLKEHYGRYVDGRPNYRVVACNEEREVRLNSLSGNYEEQWKYNYNRDQHVLERLLEVPGNIELITKTSYEPIWFFHDKDNKPLPPNHEVCEIVIDAVHKAASMAVGKKWKDPEAGLLPDELAAKEKAKIDTLIEDLFGNETDTGDALAHKQGIVVP